MKHSHICRLSALYTKISPFLRPLSVPYAWMMRKRRERGPSDIFTPSGFCVSVGNIAFGGTGKTPLVAWFMQWARAREIPAVVLSRGYKGKPGPGPLLVGPKTDAALSGDEPLMLARAFPDVPVIVFPRRAAAASFAERLFAPELVILDDAMQHLSVARDMDIVLLRPDDLREDWNRVIPCGPWREGESALDAASAFVIKAKPEDFAELVPLAQKRLARFAKPLFTFFLEPSGLEPLGQKQAANTSQNMRNIKESPYILLSGVGDSAGVAATAAAFMGRPPWRHFDFADHHFFTAADVRAIIGQAPAGLPIFCTAKDAVKLAPLIDEFAPHPVWVINVKAVFGPALFTDLDFASWWNGCWQGRVKQP